MVVTVRNFTEKDLPAMREIWNTVVEEANAFPQREPLSEGDAAAFFSGQTFTGVAETEEGEIAGLYILHPNNVGRCGHICNASYAVKKELRGKHIGELLVTDCLCRGKEFGFRILQFNAVVAGNEAAVRLYERLGFRQIGRVEGGYQRRDGSYEDILLYYIPLEDSQH